MAIFKINFRLGTRGEKPCFGNSGFRKKIWGGPTWMYLWPETANLRQWMMCVCEDTVYASFSAIYKSKQIMVETFATMEKGCLQSGGKQTK